MLSVGCVLVISLPSPANAALSSPAFEPSAIESTVPMVGLKSGSSVVSMEVPHEHKWILQTLKRLNERRKDFVSVLKHLKEVGRRLGGYQVALASLDRTTCTSTPHTVSQLKRQRNLTLDFATAKGTSQIQ